MRHGWSEQAPTPATVRQKGPRSSHGQSADHGPGMSGVGTGPALPRPMGDELDTGCPARPAQVRRPFGGKCRPRGRGSTLFCLCPAPTHRGPTARGGARNTSTGQKFRDCLGQSALDSSGPPNHPEGCQNADGRELLPKFLTQLSGVRPENVHFQQAPGDVAAAGPGTPLLRSTDVGHQPIGPVVRLRPEGGGEAKTGPPKSLLAETWLPLPSPGVPTQEGMRSVIMWALQAARPRPNITPHGQGAQCRLLTGHVTLQPCPRGQSAVSCVPDSSRHRWPLSLHLRAWARTRCPGPELRQ